MSPSTKRHGDGMDEMAQYQHVERTFGYRTFYLMHIEGEPDMRWTPDDEQAFRYEDLSEAEQDAEIYGGEVGFFESGFGHNAAARLERHFSTQIAAE